MDEPETPPPELGPIEVPTLTVKLETGPLAGRTLQMHYPSTRFWIAQERGNLDNPLLWQETLDAIEEHDLGRDPGTLPPTMVFAIMRAWLAALKAVALPPKTGSG
jgi:hypothetical protein